MKNNPRTLNTDYDQWLKKFQYETLKKNAKSLEKRTLFYFIIIVVLEEKCQVMSY